MANTNINTNSNNKRKMSDPSDDRPGKRPKSSDVTPNMANTNTNNKRKRSDPSDRPVKRVKLLDFTPNRQQLRM